MQSNSLHTGSQHEAARGISADTLYKLGHALETGDGMEKDPAQAVVCYQTAADKGHLEAKLALGRCYENGIGVQLDWKRAFAIYEELASKDYGTGSRSSRGTKIRERRKPLPYFGAANRTRTGTRLPSADFKSAVSTYSTIAT